MKLRGRLSRRRFLLGLAGGAALGGAGYGLWRASREPELRAVRLGELRPGRFDVCVIGSGFAGAALARSLASGGVRTLVLESGVGLDPPPPGWNPGALDAYESGGEVAYPVAASRMRALGGASHLWTGRCSRLHPLDFEANAYTPPGAAWPLRYGDLRPYYAQAEELLRVNGGRLSEQHAPREAPLPLPPYGNVSALAEQIAPLDLVLDPSPTSVTADAARGGPVRVHEDWLPALSQMTSATLVSGATVTRLRADGSGRVGRAEARGLDGAERAIEADVFVVAGGALETTRLLRLSGASGTRAGLGSQGGVLGRAFHVHPNLTFKATLSEGPESWAMGRSHHYYERFKHAGLGSILLVFGWSPEDRRLRIGATVEMEPREENRLELSREHRDRFGNPGTRMVLGFGARDRKTFAATEELIRGFFERLGAGEPERFPMSWSHHHLGSCRMGEDPATSVLDADLRVHGTPNLYALTSGAFVTGGAAHPTLAIVALAHRLADHLLERGPTEPG